MSAEVDFKLIWEDIYKKIMNKPIEEMTALEITERFGIFQFFSFKANKEAEKLQEEMLKIMDFKAQEQSKTMDSNMQQDKNG